MELLWVIAIGAAIGAVARYVVRGREHYGIVLLPALTASVASVVWVALTWAGLAWDGGWIWVATMAATVAVAIAVPLLLARRRAAADAALFTRLSSAR